jgi:uncharacterized protein
MTFNFLGIPLPFPPLPLSSFSTLLLSVSTIGITLFISHIFRSQKVKVKHSSSTLALISSCPSLFVYSAPRFLYSGIMHTLYTTLYRRRIVLQFTRELFVHEDKGHNALDWVKPRKSTSPVLIICHGLVGGSSERYVQWMAKEFVERFPKSPKGDEPTAVVFCARGCGGSSLSSPQAFNSAHTADLRAVVDSLHNKYPNSPLFAIGYSLGAGLLTKFVCEEGTSCKLRAAIAVCPSFDYVANSKSLESLFNMYTFNPLLTKSLTKYAKKHKEAFIVHRGNQPIGSHPTSSSFPDSGKFAAPKTSTSPRDELRKVFDIEKLLKVKTLRQFDDMATAQLFGYKTAEEYYQDASTAHRIHDIRIPYLSLNSADDDIISVADIPLDMFKKSNFAISAITREGGHVSYSLRNDPTGSSWDNNVCIEFFSAVANKLWSQNDGKEESSSGGGGGEGARAM